MNKSNANITKSLPSYDEALKRVSGDQINNNNNNNNQQSSNSINGKTSTLPNGLNTHKQSDSNRNIEIIFTLFIFY
jgi:hypothetical protein